MPANLPPQAKAKWTKVMESRTREEKLQALMEFLSAVPKHKGTEKLVMQVRRQIARLREEVELEKVKKRGGGGASFFVEKEGDAQLVLLGFSNASKSTVFKELTGIDVECSETPFETEKPRPGIFLWQGVAVQMVDTPSLVDSINSPRNAQVLALAHNADVIAVVLDATADPVFQLQLVERMLQERGVSVREERPRVIIERRASGGIAVVGRQLSSHKVSHLLRDYGIYHALVRLEEGVSLDDVEEAILRVVAHKPAVIILAKVDLWPEAAAKVVKAAGELPVIPFSFTTASEVKSALGEFVMHKLNLIRVFTRDPKSGKVSAKPLALRRGARVEDVALRIHTRLYKEFKYALVWNERRLKCNPSRVGRDFELDDLDIVEIVA